MRMNKRQKEVQQVFLNSEKAVLKQLEKNYKEALEEIDSKLEVLMARQDKDMSHVIYQIEHQRALKTQVKSILENLQSKEFDSISEYLANAYTNGFVGTMYDIHGQGIPLIIPIDQKKVLEAIKHETKLSENLYTALGHDITDLQKTIAGEISRGISSGLDYAEIARNIASQANIPKNRAMTIARTESHRIQCKATSDAQFEAKAKGADVLKQWDSTLDGHTREHHRMIDGQIRELEEPFSVGKFKPRFPGDFGDPAEDCNCRCALLQRARWALGKEELNTLKERAEFFGLDKSEEFADFKKKYLKATDRVRVSAQKTKNEVTMLEEYTVDGVTYKVDGKHVVLDNTEHEKEIANLLSESLGQSVSIVPRVVYPQGVATPDYIIDGEKYDLKEPTGTGKHVLYNMVHKKKSQANNFVFDITNCPLNYDAIKEQIEDVYSSSHTAFVDSIIVVKNGKVLEVFKKKNKKD